MPMYEYECRACGHTSESLRPIRDADAAMTCDACGSTKTARAHSVFAVAASSAPSAPAGPCGQCPSANGACPYSS